MIELYPFQAAASNQIADRVIAYHEDPLFVGRSDSMRRVPFIQFVSSITASGKTIILAHAAWSIAEQLPIKPIVLWLSKATVVVEQTFASLDVGGELHSLIDGFAIRSLAEYDALEVLESADPFLFFATVGTFNQKDKEEGSRRIFKSSIDDAIRSTWESLKLRRVQDETRRPLVVVYDEAHNLSEQQTALLLELEPDALLLSTATQRVPDRIDQEIVDVLHRSGGFSEPDLITLVDAKAVADSGLIKSTIELVGRQAPMEAVIREMLDEMAKTESDSRVFGLHGPPKAVYICKTNVIEGSSQRDDHKRPFKSRQAPPILIWRHLTEQLSVNPNEIAVYADLRFDRNYTRPSEFKLFGGKDKDYYNFIKGDYRHIIFNESLQEGWDDPLVYFAYIDKSMGSRIQAEQVVGRLLRQPGRIRYPSERLNSAQICVRVESAGVFDEVVASVQEKIQNERLTIEFIKTAPGLKTRIEYPPLKVFTVPVAAVITDAAEKPIQLCIDRMNDFSHDDGTNTIGAGRKTRVQKVIGKSGNETFVWEEHEYSAQVMARQLFTREVQRNCPNALGLALTSSSGEDATKFDARVGLGSNAAHHIRTVAEQVANEFVNNVFLKLRNPNPYEVGPILQHEPEVVKFKNAIHAGYDGLSSQELRFAHALDRTGLAWCRNPSRTGYGIPLIMPGRTENFYPDFLVWSERDVFAIDTKGAHLHADAMRKLVKIRPATPESTRVFVRFVSPGVVNEAGAKKDSTGFTVWSFKPNGNREFTHHDSIDDALTHCLMPDV